MDEQLAARSGLRKASLRLLPLIGLGYGVAYMDRANISFASLQMNQDLHLSATAYGLGGGLFFLSYAALEVPSNLVLAKVGARRWLARIMLTWGVLAMAMMLVRTPWQFYLARFLLGAAEAGFFPGIIYYLMQWFPAAQRGRAITRFYIALPLSSMTMGVFAGSLLGLNGVAGLAGWQWLFLVQGAPAVLLSAAFLWLLPDGPAQARWLTDAEREAITGGIARERGRLPPPHASLLKTLLDPLVLRLGVANILIMGAAYAYLLSAPALLKASTHASNTVVGYLVAAASLAAVFAMLALGWHCDLRRERRLHATFVLAAQALAFTVMAAAPSPAVVTMALLAALVGVYAIQAPFWLLPSDVLHGRAAAVGVAAIGSIGMLGAFAGPYAWGLAADATHGFAAGQAAIALMMAVAAVIVFTLPAPRSAAAVVELAPEGAA
jgi:ACS family tartrate transporter-like MFS transporter